MSNKTYKRVIKSTLTAIVGLSLSNSLLINPAKAENNQSQVQSRATSESLTVAANKTLEIDFLNIRLYEHKWKKRDVVTLQFKNIPLLTFISAPGYDAQEKATEFAKKLEQLSQDSIDAKEIIVSWNKKTKDYSIKYQDQELIRINKYVRLPDGKTNLSQDALQATNRLRRLIGNAKPLKEIQGKPKIIVKKDTINTNISPIQSTGKTYKGRASWYGPGFHGRRTANGEVFNQNALTAAHRTLPFGTKVKVTNLRNGRSVIVRINDRGPFSGGRIVDLSAAAAKVIGMKSSGVATVRMQILGR